MAHRRRDLAEEFKERFGREYDSQEPLLSLSEEEFHFVMGYVSPDSLYRFTYSDPVTDLTYEVLYDFDVNHGETPARLASCFFDKPAASRTIWIWLRRGLWAAAEYTGDSGVWIMPF